MGALKLAFATDVVDPCDRFDLWHEVACKAYAEHECTTQSPGSFEGVIRSAQLDKATLSIYENTPMHLWRTQRQVERAPSDRVFICLQIDSTCRISQLGRETTIGPGEFCIVETKSPYVFSYVERSRQLVLDIERSELQQRLGSVSAVTALSVEADTGIGGLAAGYMRMLPEYAAALSPATGHQVANQVLNLVAMALARRAELGHVKLGSASALTLIRLRTAIEQALPYRDVKCQEVAERAGISVRYANALLAKEGTSLERLLQKRRLENCHKALAEASGRSISEIAFAWGFSDVSHFSKTFKSAYGVSPRDFRREVAQSRSRETCPGSDD
jgi:AraC family transcriptional activator of tynA and feaB